uniref:plasmid partitioning protein RepB n=1 Tax=Methylobacterium sp. TaxID=409 RepID=UPI0020C9A410|nr:plasmid partitioning protein RepB [Methylobacterium sp.]USU34615.1 plasmid partitioning protein RepB [Methylobacterium sp.]
MASLWLSQTAAQDGAVVELDPNLCDPSAVADRVPDTTDAAFNAFVEQVREEGQHTPILVRRHPEAVGRYEIAYGSRRTRAARAIGVPVRAIVRELSDRELIIAQGSENLAREDLSYIERAHFARNMELAGIDRETILKAMGVHRPDLVNYLAIAEAIPAPVLSAIGPAPKIGRPRWLTLADRIKSAPASQVDAALASSDLAGKTSDERFAAVLAALSAVRKPPRRARVETLKNSKGLKYASVERNATGLRVTVEDAAEPGFGDYLADRIPEILAAFRADKA